MEMGASAAALSAGEGDQGHSPSRWNGPHRRRSLRRRGDPRGARQPALPALQPGHGQHDEAGRQDDGAEEQPRQPLPSPGRHRDADGGRSPELGAGGRPRRALRRSRSRCRHRPDPEAGVPVQRRRQRSRSARHRARTRRNRVRR